VDLERQNARKAVKVLVEREDRQTTPDRDGRDEQVDGGQREALRAATVEDTSPFLMVRFPDRKVGKRAEPLAECFEILLLANPGEHLLADHAEEHRLAGFDQPTPFLQTGPFVLAQIADPATKGQRPDGGVDENVQREPRRRRAL
jgi:hypothetical protein